MKLLYFLIYIILFFIIICCILHHIYIRTHKHKLTRIPLTRASSLQQLSHPGCTRHRVLHTMYLYNIIPALLYPDNSQSQSHTPVKLDTIHFPFQTLLCSLFLLPLNLHIFVNSVRKSPPSESL